MKNFNPSTFRPDFLQIPNQVFSDRELSAVDMLVYGIIYWYKSLKGEKCFASNRAFAEILGVTAKKISESISRLYKKGYVHVVYLDGERKEIIPLITYRPHPRTEYPPHPRTGETPPPNGGQIENIYKEKDIYIQSVREIFEYWNKKRVPTHRVLSPRIETEVRRKLKIYTVEEIKAVIDFYETILERGVDPQKKKYYWSHEWGLYELLFRGWEKFEGKKPENYLKKTFDVRQSERPKFFDFNNKK